MRWDGRGGGVLEWRCDVPANRFKRLESSVAKPHFDLDKGESKCSAGNETTYTVLLVVTVNPLENGERCVRLDKNYFQVFS